MIKNFYPIMRDLENSEIVILDFNQISEELPDFKSIKKFFEECKKIGINPKSPENRQKFNNIFLEKIGKKYLIGRYGEDRIEMLRGTNIEKEGRTIHLGIDIFSKNQDSVYCPYEGEIIRTGFESGSSSFGHYIIIKHNITNQIIYTFYGHLSDKLPKLGKIIAGAVIAKLGDANENGGWSRHLHFQLMTQLLEKTPIGYSTKKDFEENKKLYPDPCIILGDMDNCVIYSSYSRSFPDRELQNK